MIVGLVGKAGSGKDTVADLLVTFHGFAAISLADPIKHFCMNAFGWPPDQLWGPSELRSIPDSRSKVWICNHCRWFGQSDKLKIYSEDHNPRCPACGSWDNLEEHPLSPRIALQTLGTEWGRAIYPDIWITLSLRRARAILEDPNHMGNTTLAFPDSARLPSPVFSEKNGTIQFDTSIAGVIISDVRFINEARAIREHGGRLLLIRRPVTDVKLEGIQDHASELEQDSIPKEWYDYTINNTGTLDNLRAHVSALAEELVQPRG